MDDEVEEDNTSQKGQTITILKPRLSLRIIWAYNCSGYILQDISRQKMMS